MISPVALFEAQLDTVDKQVSVGAVRATASLPILCGRKRRSPPKHREDGSGLCWRGTSVKESGDTPLE